MAGYSLNSRLQPILTQDFDRNPFKIKPAPTIYPYPGRYSVTEYLDLRSELISKWTLHTLADEFQS